jgi:hypothetical protein
MKCPICGKEKVSEDRWGCWHGFEKYTVYYVLDILNEPITIVDAVFLANDPIRDEEVFRLNGWVFLDGNRIEKLLLLK